MNVLVTGSKGFVGRNLVESLKCIRDGKDCRVRYAPLLPLGILEVDRDTSPSELDAYCAEADFVFHLAGVNRPDEPHEFMEGNFGFSSDLLKALEQVGNTCPVMLASSAQASLEGRYADGEYGKSKLAGEALFHDYAERTGSKTLVYRLPNLFGKWCRPNYNSAIATFCHNIANNLPITVSDPSIKLDLLYIDDLVLEMLSALLGEEARGEDGFCHAGPVDSVTLGEIVDLLNRFKAARESLSIPVVADGSFSKKLYTTYMSHLDPTDFSYGLKANTDVRGSFTEVLKTCGSGQLSVNVSKPGIIRGNHWHHTKWEKFVVVSGEGLIRERKIGADSAGKPFPVFAYRVSGGSPEVVEMVPGFTHSIENLSKTEDLITLIWANELFDPANPDTFYEEV